MALERKKVNEIPSDAIILSEEEAFQYHYKLLNSWKKPLDTFAIKYGSFILGSSCMLPGFYFNNYFRTKFKLFHYGRMASYLPICIVPGTLAFLLHHELVLRNLILLKQEKCPICIEMRAVTIHSILGCVLPMILAPISSISLAHRYVTYDLPSITKKPLEVLKVVRNQIKPIKNIIFGIFIGQALLASAVTYFEAQSVYKVSYRLSQLQEQLEKSYKT